MHSRRNFLTLFSNSPALRPNHSRAIHLLHRITYGPTPAAVEQIDALGYDNYLEQQLNPDQLIDDKVAHQLGRFALLDLPRKQLATVDSYRLSQAIQYGMVARAVHSERQLLERMFEFWTDHFNVSIGDESFELVSYHQTIRKHALGNFAQLLAATAKHPAMLVYLDNYVNYAEHPNENYARELLELHTMGVNGGYTEDDVRAVSRAFTGWTIRPNSATGFYFDPYYHDDKAKVIFGRTLPANRGIDDGFHVLQMLANHPSTAAYISRKLCVRFVSDTPPDDLVASTTQTFLNSRGDIKTVLRHILTSPEFAASSGQKLRRPLSFLIGALRATQTQINADWVMDEMLDALDQRPFNWHPPNGYPDVAGAWANPNGTLARWNVAMRLTHAAHSDRFDTGWAMKAELHKLIDSSSNVNQLVTQLSTHIFGEPISTANAQPFIAYASDNQGGETECDTHLLSRKLPSLFGLMLASPLYQWH